MEIMKMFGRVFSTGGTEKTRSSDSEQEESDGGMTEIRFVPDDKAALDAMFTSMSECQVSGKQIN